MKFTVKAEEYFKNKQYALPDDDWIYDLIDYDAGIIAIRHNDRLKTLDELKKEHLKEHLKSIWNYPDLQRNKIIEHYGVECDVYISHDNFEFRSSIDDIDDTFSLYSSNAPLEVYTTRGLQRFFDCLTTQEIDDLSNFDIDLDRQCCKENNYQVYVNHLYQEYTRNFESYDQAFEFYQLITQNEHAFNSFTSF